MSLLIFDTSSFPKIIALVQISHVPVSTVFVYITAATYPSLMSLLSVRVCEERRSLSFGIISCGTNIG